MDYDNKFKDFESQYNLERKFESLEHELEVLSEQPFFARVNNRTVVRVGEVAYLPCRVKFIQQGYMVRILMAHLCMVSARGVLARPYYQASSLEIKTITKIVSIKLCTIPWKILNPRFSCS